MVSLSSRYVCIRCGKTKSVVRHRELVIASNKRTYVCPKCYNIINEKVLKENREKRRIEVIKQTSKFSDYLENCNESGTCDILKAHHESLKHDPERLTTEFMINQICGDDRLKEYRNKRSLKM